METVAVPPAARPAAIGSYDRLFYSGIAVALALTVVVGFGQTYYFRLFGAAPLRTLSGGPVTPLVHAHATLFSAWMLLFICQTALIAQRKVAVHRRLGVAGAVLAGMMVPVGTITALRTAARGGGPPGIDPLSFLIIPLTDMLLFGGFVAAALLLRRNREAHKRVMLLACITIVVAAVARLPGVLPFGPPAFFGLSFLFLAAGCIYDRAVRRRVHPAYVWGGALLVLSVPLRLAISTTSPWLGLASWMVSLV